MAWAWMTAQSRTSAHSVNERGVSRHRTWRREHLFSNARLGCAPKRRFKLTTDNNRDLPIAPNLLDRPFTMTEPDKRRLLGRLLQRAAVRIVEGGATARPDLRHQAASQGCSNRPPALVRTPETEFDAGLCQPDEV